MRTARPKPKQVLSATALAFAGAACWACLVGAASVAKEPGRTLILYGALGFGPAMLIFFAALAAREATRARIIATRIAGLTETTLIAPSPESIARTRDLAQTLREEIQALDAVVRTTAHRLDAFENGLRADGGLLARALVDDINTMGRVRQELNEGALAVGEAIGRHVAALRETSAQVREETTAAAETFGAQLQAFGAISATLGARSAEFAAAANASTGSAQKLDAAVDKALQTMHLETDQPHVLREAFRCIRKGGTFSIPGVYIGMVDMLPFGTAMNKGLTMKMGQTHVQRYSQKLLSMIQDGSIDPSFVITHTCTLDEGPEMYKTFRDKKDGCIKVVLKP